LDVKKRYQEITTRRKIMSEIVKVGESVPNFEMEVFDPAKVQFGKISLDEIKSKGKWTVLIFYPADYTFVCPTELAEVRPVKASWKKPVRL
jgi:peroxiredoxin (alkyl hydroperoxide reductase subunit C)